MAAMTDPDEVLEVFDPDGRPTGQAKARGRIHLDGDWHLAFFCWIARSGPAGVELVLQKRSDGKDVFPSRFDASAAGHVRFGESRTEMLREVREELGLTVSESDLLALPRHRQEHVHANGIVDREHHDLNLLRCDLPLSAYAPSQLEVSGLAPVPAAALADLAEGLRDEVETELVEHLADGSFCVTPLRLRREHLVPYERGYHRRLAEQASKLVTRSS